MKIILFIVFSLLMLHLEGQNHLIGIKADQNRTTNAIGGDKFKNEPRSGWEGGLMYEYLIDKHFSLGANIMYKQRGFGFRDTFLNYLWNPNLTNHIDEVAYHFDYLSVPINAAYHLGSHRHMGMNLALGLKYALTSYTPKQADASRVLDGYYLERSKIQKTTAKYLLYGGLGFAAVGGIVQLAHENSRNGGFNLDFTGAWMAIGGGCVSLISVPFFISSHVNARKAATLSLGDQAIFIPQLQPSVNKSVPSASLKIKF